MTATRATVALGAVGAAVSAYLSWVHWSGELALCLGVGGCATVQASRFAVVGPIPVAAIGLAGFLTIVLVAAWRLAGRAPEWSGAALFGMSLAGVLYVAYLTWLELFVIGEVCPWCVSVALAMAAIFALTLGELRRA